MSGYEHANKRQRTDDGSRDEDRLRPPPSPCVHVRGLSEHALERDLMEAVSHFGIVRDVIIIPRKRQAFVEFEDIKGAKNCVEYCQSGKAIFVAGVSALFNYSLSQSVKKQGDVEDSKPANHILLFTILNPQYPITVDVMHTICSPYGQVQRIVIFKKNGCQAMVEFESLECAKRAKATLNGADIYSGCCTLKIDYAKPTKLNVRFNDSDSWDYTNPNLGERGHHGQPLLQEPRFGSGPSPYRKPHPFHSDGPAGFGGSPGAGGFHGSRGPPGGYYDDYEPGYGPPGPYGGPDRFGPKRGPDFGRNYDGPHGGPQGAVCMVYGLNMDKMNCDRIFNLFCLYGNVIRVKFLKSKEGSAMVQMGGPIAVDRAIQNLSNAMIFGNNLQLSVSKQPFLQEVNNPHELPDGSTSYRDYAKNRNNRFSNPEAAQKNRIQSPTRVLHFFNAPPNITESEINEIFDGLMCKVPVKIKSAVSKTERSSTGSLEFENKEDSVEALVMANHTPITSPGGKAPFIFKLCFSAVPSV